MKKQHHTIVNKDDGYELKPLAHRGIVLSGGGAKGFCYIGMIKAMKDNGFLNDITHISGASAGAMTSSLIALGMSPDDIDSIISDISTNNLLNINYSYGEFRSTGVRFQNFFNLIYLYQIKKCLANIEAPAEEDKQSYQDYNNLCDKLEWYDFALQEIDINISCAEDIVALSHNKEKLNTLDYIFSMFNKHSIRKNNGYKQSKIDINFSDITKLRNLLNPTDARKIKKLYINVTNQIRCECEIYSETHSPLASVAQKVQQSGAHPFIFQPTLNENGEHLADGGIMDNMPVDPLLDAGLYLDEILCVKLSDDSEFKDSLKSAMDPILNIPSSIYNLMDEFFHQVLGGKVYNNWALNSNNEKVFHFMDNMLILNSGEITATHMNPSAKQKAQAIISGYNATEDWLEQRVKKFDCALLSMLYLGKSQLEQILESNNSQTDLVRTATRAQDIFILQQELANSLLEEVDPQLIISILKQIEEKVFAEPTSLTTTQQFAVFALVLKQVNFLSHGLLGNYFIELSLTTESYSELNYIEYILYLLWLPIELIFSAFQNSSAPANENEKLKSSQDELVHSYFMSHGKDNPFSPSKKNLLTEPQISPSAIVL